MPVMPQSNSPEGLEFGPRRKSFDIESALAGADVVTMPYKVVTQLLKHPLTDIGQDKFLADWKKLTG